MIKKKCLNSFEVKSNDIDGKMVAPKMVATYVTGYILFLKTTSEIAQSSKEQPCYIV